MSKHFSLTMPIKPYLITLLLTCVLVLRQVPDSFLVNLGVLGCMQEMMIKQLSIVSLVQERHLVPDTGKCVASLHYFEQAVAWDEGNPQAWGWLGTVKLLQANFAEAYADLQTALALAPNILSEFKIGTVLYRASEPSQGIAIWHRIESANLFTETGRSERLGGNLSSAEYYHRLAIEIAPNSSDPHLELGEDLFAQGKHAEAMIEYQIGLANLTKHSRSNLGEVAYHQALIYSSRQQYALAIESLAQALKSHSRYPPYLIAVAKNYDALGDRVSAETWFERAINIDDPQATANFEYGNYFVRHRRYADAIAQYEQAITRNPNNPLYAQQLNSARNLANTGK